MSALAESPDRLELLRHKAEHAGQLAAPLRAVPGREAAGGAGGGLGAVDDSVAAAAARRQEWYRTLEDAILDLSNALPEGVEDYDARKLLEFLLGLRRAIDADPEVLDARGDVELHAQMMRDVLRRIERRLLHNELDDPRTAADFVFATLAGAGAGELARLLGVSTKTIGAWRAGRPVTRNAGRVVIAAQVLTHLRSSLTPSGLLMWFDARRAQLDGRTPLELLDEDEASAREALIGLARGARGQLAD